MARANNLITLPALGLALACCAINPIKTILSTNSDGTDLDRLIIDNYGNSESVLAQRIKYALSKSSLPDFIQSNNLACARGYDDCKKTVCLKYSHSYNFDSIIIAKYNIFINDMNINVKRGETRIDDQFMKSKQPVASVIVRDPACRSLI